MRIGAVLLVMAVAYAPIAAVPVFAAHPAKPVGDAVRGAALAQRWCGTCHLQAGQHSGSDAAPSFSWVAQQARSDPSFIRAFLNKPHAPMPPLDLDQAEIADLVAYLEAGADAGDPKP